MDVETVSSLSEISQLYTEFFSWGSDKYGQLGLAEQDEEADSNLRSTGSLRNGGFGRKMFYSEPRHLSFDIMIESLACGS